MKVQVEMPITRNKLKTFRISDLKFLTVATLGERERVMGKVWFIKEVHEGNRVNRPSPQPSPCQGEGGKKRGR